MDKTYQLDNLSCANCARKFEENVKALPGVSEAKVFFGTSKLRVSGEASLEELNAAGAFDGIQVQLDAEGQNRKQITSFLRPVLSVLFLIIAWTLDATDAVSTAVYVLLYGASALIGGYSMFQRGIRNLFRLDFDMNVLMTVAVIGAAFIGEWREGAVVAFLFAVSETLEKMSMNRARRSIQSLLDLKPKMATVRRENREQSLPVEEIQKGDIILVQPGEKIALDGVILAGNTTVDQATITGESIPVEKTVGDDVFAGTLNQQGAIDMEVTRRSEDTTLAKIIRMVEEAQAQRAPVQAFVDRFAGIYTPVIMGLAAFIAVLPPIMMGASWDDWIYRGLALLVVACPCALVISTPVSLLSAIGNAAKNGVLIKGGIHLEQAGTLQALALDKTGTLTQGAPTVTDIIPMGEESSVTLLQTAASVEKRSEHPLAQAIVQSADEKSIEFLPAKEFQALTGKGAEAVIRDRLVRVGSPRLFREKKMWNDTLQEIVFNLQRQGKTAVLVGDEQSVYGVLGLADSLRKNSRQAVQSLKDTGIKRIVMLTGDHMATAQAIGKQAGMDEVYAELLPDEKVARIKELKNDYGGVAMTGDGVNDAPALANATIGIAMGGAGSDTALETADIVLMGDDLSKLPFMIRLSRKAMRVIKQNIIFSLGTKLLALLLIFPGWLTLWVAILIDMGASLAVTTNGMRLFRMKTDKKSLS